MQALKRRSGMFLLIEFLALVAGVFLGVQVDRWYEDRQEQRDDQNYLFRLQNDVAVMTAEYEALLKGVAYAYAQSLTARRSVDSCDPSSVDRKSLDQVLSGHQVLLSFPVSRSAYDEMIASGAFARIENVELKNTVSDLYRTIDSSQDSLNYLRQDLGRASSILLTRFPFTNDAEGQLMVADYDFESVCQVTDIKSSLAEVVDSRADWILSGKSIHDKLKQVTAVLTRELNGP